MICRDNTVFEDPVLSPGIADLKPHVLSTIPIASCQRQTKVAVTRDGLVCAFSWRGGEGNVHFTWHCWRPSSSMQRTMSLMVGFDRFVRHSLEQGHLQGSFLVIRLSEKPPCIHLDNPAENRAESKCCVPLSPWLSQIILQAHESWLE